MNSTKHPSIKKNSVQTSSASQSKSLENGGEEFIYDWNSVDRKTPVFSGKILFLDETLRDGLQSPSVVNPPIADKIMLLHTMSDLGIHYADIGLPGAGGRAYRDVYEMVREIREAGLSIKPACAARTLDKDVGPILDIAEKTGVQIEVMAFIGSSPIRQFVEEWDKYRMYKLVRESIRLARSHGMPVTFVTEDTTRAKPDMLYPLFHVAIESGAMRLCLADTVGHATPDGLRALINFVQNLVKAMGKNVELDFHGHNDRGLALVNSLFALEYGATRVHGTALGIGERCGNASMDQILMNLKLLGAIDNDLSKLLLYCKQASLATRWQVPHNYPLIGQDAFRTSTGVHAAAILKARRMGAAWLADRIYSGVPAGLFGRKQEVEVGPLSGESNVTYWLETHGYEAKSGLVKKILEVAKQSNRILDKIEIEFLVERYSETKSQGANTHEK